MYSETSAYGAMFMGAIKMHGAKQLSKGQVLRLSSITFYQNTRHIPRLDSATDKGFNTYFFCFL